MAKNAIISPMEASNSRPCRETGPSGTNYNQHGEVFNYGVEGDTLKHLTAPHWPVNLNAEGNFSGSAKKTGDIAGRKYGEGFADTFGDKQPESPTWKKKGR